MTGRFWSSATTKHFSMALLLAAGFPSQGQEFGRPRVPGRLRKCGEAESEHVMMIATREVTYEVDGLSMIAHLAQPDSPGPWPAVLLGHDGVGLEEYQRQRADDLAAHGYA